jgi:hypothetical protein
LPNILPSLFEIPTSLADNLGSVADLQSIARHDLRFRVGQAFFPFPISGLGIRAWKLWLPALVTRETIPV